LWKNAPSRSDKEAFKKFVDMDPEADVFQNLISSSLHVDDVYEVV